MASNLGNTGAWAFLIYIVIKVILPQQNRLYEKQIGILDKVEKSLEDLSVLPVLEKRSAVLDDKQDRTMFIQEKHTEELSHIAVEIAEIKGMLKK